MARALERASRYRGRENITETRNSANVAGGLLLAGRRARTLTQPLLKKAESRAEAPARCSARGGLAGALLEPLDLARRLQLVEIDRLVACEHDVDPIDSRAPRPIDDFRIVAE